MSSFFHVLHKSLRVVKNMPNCFRELTSDMKLSIELAINIFGVMTAYWVDYGMSFVDSEAQFRFPLAFQCLFALVTILLMVFLPESPRWVCTSLFMTTIIWDGC